MYNPSSAAHTSIVCGAHLDSRLAPELQFDQLHDVLQRTQQDNMPWHAEHGPVEEKLAPEEPFAGQARSEALGKRAVGQRIGVSKAAVIEVIALLPDDELVSGSHHIV